MAGSSPRLRGTLSRTERRSCSRRFIPAFAGNATREIDAERELPVHPRVCGERTLPLHHWLTVAGSSPRLRGTQSMTVTLGGITRFIPAFAGNAASSRPASTPRPVHPRVCGERTLVHTPPICTIGSSPRLRGTHGRQFPGCQRDRFIPAFAGNASLCLMVRLNAAVHPRVCGERGTITTAGSTGAGSSPRLRGTRQASKLKVESVRFIPAFAGNAVAALVLRSRGAVHPRVCGERYEDVSGRAHVSGSSPRLRGTRRSGIGVAHLVRFIPAFAGNASLRRRWIR